MTTTQRDAAIKEWAPYVERTVRSLHPYSAGFEIEDWISIGYVALIKALYDYDPAKHDFPFVAHLYNYIRWDIGSEKYRQKARKRDISLFGDMGLDGWEDYILPANDYHRDLDLYAAMQKLPAIQHQVIYAYYWDQYTDLEIGESLGISNTGSFYHRTEALKKLRTLLEGDKLPPKGYYLTKKQQAFSDDYAKTGDMVGAVRRAGYKGPDNQLAKIGRRIKKRLSQQQRVS